MNTRKALLLLLSLHTLLITGSCAQRTPKLTLSATRIQHHGQVGMQGTGFTPKQNVTSHLRRPDGTEFPVLPILTDDRGGFTHDIDTLLLSPGTHEVWVVDDSSNISSNVARFEVTLEAPQ